MSANIDQIKNELERYVDQNPKILQGAILSKKIELNKHAKLLTKVRGEFATVNSVLGHVVQLFRPEWTALGDSQFRGKVMRNYHQKVNFPFTPAEILGSWIEKQYDEGKDLKNKSISKHVIDLLKEKIISDVDWLTIHGVYNEALALGPPVKFGHSMDGLNEVITKLKANTTNPCFKIPINAITDANIVDEITTFERLLPEDYKPLVSKVFVSQNNKERYILAYEDAFGQNTDYRTNNKLYTRLGKREIIGIHGMDDGVILASVRNNLFQLVDLIQNPATITDIQKQDYTIKIFGEFTLGYDFAINELVLVGDDSVSDRGLGDVDLNRLYYPNENW